jgi:hypothetical protein
VSPLQLPRISQLRGLSGAQRRLVAALNRAMREHFAAGELSLGDTRDAIVALADAFEERLASPYRPAVVRLLPQVRP